VAALDDKIAAAPIVRKMRMIIFHRFEEDPLLHGKLDITALGFRKGDAGKRCGPPEGLRCADVVVGLQEGEHVAADLTLKALIDAFCSVDGKTVVSIAKRTFLEMGPLHLEAGLGLYEGDYIDA
jgi:hypothetical protein